MHGVTDASPPRFITLEEIMSAAKSMSDMALAHEIAVDSNFELTKFEPPENRYETNNIYFVIDLCSIFVKKTCYYYIII